MLLAIVAVILGLAVLVWSADKFVDGAVGIARFCGMSTLLIGMVIVGFGTSAPELTVSALSAGQGNPEIALGNAYGSNIANIALILGATAAVSPILMQRSVIRGDLPILTAVSILSIVLVVSGDVTRWKGVVLLVVFAFVMGYSIRRELRKHKLSKDENDDADSDAEKPSLGISIFKLVLGLLLLVASSRALVWGAVAIARSIGVSDLLIGLTIVAIGTSLPELASSIAAARKGENDLALGNIIGSNLFNTLAVVGLAAVISPMDEIESTVFMRDMPLMTALTVALIVLGYRRKGEARLNRIAGVVLLAIYFGYLGLLIAQA